MRRNNSAPDAKWPFDLLLPKMSEMNDGRTHLAKKAAGLNAWLKVFRIDDRAETTAIEITHRGQRLKVALKRNGAARRFTLRVRGATSDIVLTMPARASLGQARDFAEAHAEWLANRLARLPQRAPFLPGATIPLRGVEHKLRHCPRPAMRRGPVWVEDADGTPSICASGEPAHFERRIGDFLREKRAATLNTRSANHAEKTGRRPISLTLRDTSSRWGSCSAKGALNFSWRLILAPPFVLDYLAAHETRPSAPSRPFGPVLGADEKPLPANGKAEAWLKVHGAELHRYGRRGGEGAP